MVITLYADRRFHEVTDIAVHLASAIVPLVDPARVLLVSARPPIDVVGTDVAGISAVGTGLARAYLDEAGVTPDMGEILRGTAGRHAVTVVAVVGAPSPQVLTALDVADRVLLVSDASVPSLRATQRAVKLCASLGYGLDKVAVVLHDFTENAPLAPGEVARALKREIFWVIPGPAADPPRRTDSFARLAQRLTSMR